MVLLVVNIRLSLWKWFVVCRLDGKRLVKFSKKIEADWKHHCEFFHNLWQCQIVNCEFQDQPNQAPQEFFTHEEIWGMTSTNRKQSSSSSRHISTSIHTCTHQSSEYFFWEWIQINLEKCWSQENMFQIPHSRLESLWIFGFEVMMMAVLFWFQS